LFADDSAIARMLVEESLKTMGVAYSAGEARQRSVGALGSNPQRCRQPMASAPKTRWPWVLTDLEMPEMDGFTLTRSIKNATAALRAFRSLRIRQPAGSSQ